MGISTDPRRIEKLEQLEGVLSLLQNPESYTKLLADVKNTIAQYRELAARYTSVNAASQHLQDAQTLLANAKAESKKLLEDAEAQAATALAELAKQRAALVDREDRLASQEASMGRDLQRVADEQQKL